MFGNRIFTVCVLLVQNSHFFQDIIDHLLLGNDAIVSYALSVKQVAVWKVCTKLLSLIKWHYTIVFIYTKWILVTASSVIF